MALLCQVHPQTFTCRDKLSAWRDFPQVKSSVTPTSRLVLGSSLRRSTHHECSVSMQRSAAKIGAARIPGLNNDRRHNLNANQLAVLRPRGRGSSRSATTCAASTAAAELAAAVPPEFGFVILTAVASAIVVHWQSIMVAVQRRAAGLPYPKMYEDKEDSLFNCYQRAHQNTLENYPSFIALLLLAGPFHPITAAGFGMLWVVGRVFHSLGYYTGKPGNRNRGAFNYFGLYGLMGTCLYIGVRKSLLALMLVS